jgi:anti-sigma B factor antagonist
MYKNRLDDTIYVIHLHGELDHTLFKELVPLLDRGLHVGLKRVVLDLSDVTHLDYRGIDNLSMQRRRHLLCGGDLRLAGLNEYLLQIIRAAGHYMSFETYQSVHEARESYRVVGALP